MSLAMLLAALGCIAVFILITLGLAWPAVAHRPMTPAEKIVATAGLSLVGVFLFAWIIYVFALPRNILWLLPLIALAGLLAKGRAFADVWREPEVRALGASQMLVTLWCLGWLATITSYSGGGWTADWFEHWERTRFFLEHGSLDQQFIGKYLLPARPPLANVITGAFLQLSRVDFAHYQLVSTLLGSLAFLPAALLARRWGGPQAIAVLAVVFMLNGLFLQNATFAWTKLPAAFFVLAALWFSLRARDDSAAGESALWCGLFLGAGVIAHYSAAPYATILAFWWAGTCFARGWAPARARQTVFIFAGGAAVVAAWVLWSLVHYGAAGTFLSNTSATSADLHEGNQLAKIGRNLFDTIVPHFLRPLDTALIAQRSAWGWWRDWFFQLYQTNLLFATGSIAWLVILREARRAAAKAAPNARQFWIVVVPATIVLGIAVHGGRDHWGLVHICLQPMVLLALAFLASRADTIGEPWRTALLVGAVIDLGAGILLQFGVESFALDRWFTPGWPSADAFTRYSETTVMNLAAKLEHRLVFFSDALAVPLPIVLVLLAVVLGIGIWRLRGAAWSARIPSARN